MSNIQIYKLKVKNPHVGSTTRISAHAFPALSLQLIL